MKKIAIFVVSAMVVLGLAACGAENTGGSNGNKQGNNVEQSQGSGNEKKESVPTVDELIEKSTVASAEMKSFSVDMKMKQHILIGQGEETKEQNVDMTIKSDFIKDPLKMVQEIVMEMPEGNQLMTQYITEEGIFTQVDGVWYKQPDAALAEMIASLEDSVKPEKQLENFKSIAQDTKITEEGNEYIMTAEMSGDSVKDLAKSLMGQSGGNSEEVAAMIDSMNIKSIKVLSAMNKETFLPTRSDVVMQAEMEQEGMKFTLDMDIESTMSKYNEVGEINVPQEALDAPSM